MVFDPSIHDIKDKRMFKLNLYNMVYAGCNAELTEVLPSTM